jgi:hypothetical protein
MTSSAVLMRRPVAMEAVDHYRSTRGLMSGRLVDMVAELRDQRVHGGQATVLGEFQAGTKSA